MKKTQEYNIRKVGQQFEVQQQEKVLMDAKEAITELNSYEDQIRQLQAQAQHMEKAIEEKKLETDHKKVLDALHQAEKMHKKLHKLLEPHLEAVKIRLTEKCRDLARLQEYKDASMAEKIVQQNNLLGPLAHQEGISMNHVIIKELKKNFDSL